MLTQDNAFSKGRTQRGRNNSKGKGMGVESSNETEMGDRAEGKKAAARYHVKQLPH